MKRIRLFHLIHLAHRALFRAADRVLVARYGITAAQNALLMFLDKEEGASMGAAAEALGLKHAAMSGLVDRMEKKGLIARRASPTDGRSTTLALCDAGRAIVTESHQLITATNSRLLDGFSSDEQKIIERFLRTVAETADTIETTEQVATPERHAGKEGSSTP